MANMDLNPQSFSEWMADPNSTLETLPEVLRMLEAVKPKYKGCVPNAAAATRGVALFLIFMSELAGIIRANGYQPEKMGLVANGALVYWVLEDPEDPECDIDVYIATREEHSLNAHNMSQEAWLRDYVQPARVATAALIGDSNMLPIQIERVTINDSVKV